jgi:beta-glucosidase
VSLVDNFAVPVPLMETSEHIAAAQAAFPFCGQNGGILYPALTGAYHPAFLQQLGKHAPQIQPGDLEIIHQPLDRLGFNLYTGTYVRLIDRAPGFELLPFPSTYPRMHMPWLQIVPDALYWGVRHVSETLNLPDLPIVITENGCAADDQMQSGEVLDSDRIFYLRQYLKAAQRATQEGYLLKGYFVWSLMDNFEWAWGYDRRFGIVYVDYRTQQRIPKASAEYYAGCVRQNRVG